ncbi:hypothetical protein C8D77_12054 [Mesorhizobium loti]|uniref:Uncharacterized protein n=1 Tax=Rhizobium loti TaxID=381 RepID=A0A8E2W624_RHILI|nr:hypothetical protein [Mesorhizobium loti]PWJ86956.1 hypothetical protein C8D77_12054 [Mesorhizobium loti]
MSQSSVEPPILPEGNPDREINCEVALEAAFAALVTASEAQGWTSQETATGLLKIATEHAQRIAATAAAAAPGATNQATKDVSENVRVETITPKIKRDGRALKGTKK